MLLLFFLLIPLTIADIARADSAQLLRETYQSEVTGTERDYFIYLPNDFDERKRWPVLLFLHGNGERGNAKSELGFVLAPRTAVRSLDTEARFAVCDHRPTAANVRNG